MNHLKQVQITLLRGKLDVRMRQLREDISRELQRSESERHREVAGAVADAGDESVANLVVDLDAAEIARDVRELRAIELAIGRLKEGTYGICIDCNEPVGWPRLLAEPEAARCVRCEEKYERSHAHASIPRL